MKQSFFFWLSLAVFQVVFGLVVFAITRDYYMPDDEAPVELEAQSSGPFSSIDPTLVDSLAPPNDPTAIARAADEQFAAGRYARAAELYERLLAFDPQNVDTLNNLGLTLHYSGRSDEALRRLNEGTAADPGYQRIWLTLGFVNSSLGNSEAARDALAKAVELNPDNDVGRSAAGMLGEMSGS